LFQSSQIFGNLMLSLVLGTGNGSTSSGGPINTVSSASAGLSKSKGLSLTKVSQPLNSSRKKNHEVLFFIFSSFVGLGILGLLFLPKSSQSKLPFSAKERLLGVLYITKEPMFIAFIPIFLFNGYSPGIYIYICVLSPPIPSTDNFDPSKTALIFADFTKSMVSVALGVGMVGYIMTIYGTLSSASSFIFGKLMDSNASMLVVGLNTFFHASFCLYFLVGLEVWTKRVSLLTFTFPLSGLCHSSQITKSSKKMK